MDAQTRYEKRAYFSGKRFVPLIFHLFSIEGGARHPWQLSAIATAIATWLGALSRSHGTRAHHKGGANSGEVQKTAQGERKGCTRTWKTNAPRAHRVVHRAHRAYISLYVPHPLCSGLSLITGTNANTVEARHKHLYPIHQKPTICPICPVGSKQA